MKKTLVKDKIVKEKEETSIKVESSKKEYIYKGKKIRPFEIIAFIIIATIIGICGGTFFTCFYLNSHHYLNSYENVKINKNLKEFSSIYETIVNDYYKTTNSDKLINSAIQGMISSLGDPYASYMSKDEKQAFDERMQGEYYGIGVELLNNIDNQIVISDVFDNTSAKQKGLQIGDIITAIDDKVASSMTPSDLATYIKSSDRKTFDLKVKRNDQEIKISDIKKTKVILKSVIAQALEKNNQRVGYINISLFANNTYDQFQKAVLDMEKQNIKGLIIDVRYNTGGYLHIANQIISMFLPKNTTIYELQTQDVVQRIYDLTDEKRTYPITVLINGESASASEILAAALRDNLGSTLVGEKSYGKGTVQQTHDTDNGSMIKFTIQNWLTPKGDCIEGKGLTPDTEIVLDDKYKTEPTMENDNQLQKALELMTK